MVRSIAWVLCVGIASVAVASEKADEASKRKAKLLVELTRLEDEMNGQSMRKLPNGEHVRLVTDTHAFDVEWSTHWLTSIGASLYGVTYLEKRPGIILLRTDGDMADVRACERVCRRAGIKLILRDTNKGTSTVAYTPSEEELIAVEAVRALGVKARLAD